MLKSYTRSFLFLLSVFFSVLNGIGNDLCVFSVVLHYHMLMHGVISSNVICYSDEILGTFLHG